MYLPYPNKITNQKIKKAKQPKKQKNQEIKKSRNQNRFFLGIFFLFCWGS